ILLFFVSLPTFVEQITNKTLNGLFLFIYFFMFSYLPLTIIVFLFLSAVAYIGTGIAKLLIRNLRFSLLWKMSAYLIIIPLLFYVFLFTLNDNCFFTLKCSCLYWNWNRQIVKTKTALLTALENERLLDYHSFYFLYGAFFLFSR